MQVTLAIGGEVVGVMVAKPKDFKTGSRGYNLQTKVDIGGKAYQFSGNLVEIGSKNGGQPTG